MPVTSAGLLMFRFRGGQTEVLLVHPGGPFWAKKDWGAWSIPKGEYAGAEVPLEAAKREFREETGVEPQGDYLPLEPVKQPSGKIVRAWAVEGDCDASAVKSNTFRTQWPRGSGQQQDFPEIDRAAWFAMPEAGQRILKGQRPLLEQLDRIVRSRRLGAGPGGE